MDFLDINNTTIANMYGLDVELVSDTKKEQTDKLIFVKKEVVELKKEEENLLKLVKLFSIDLDNNEVYNEKKNEMSELENAKKERFNLTKNVKALKEVMLFIHKELKKLYDEKLPDYELIKKYPFCKISSNN